jgi:hypothetical protein
MIKQRGSLLGVIGWGYADLTGRDLLSLGIHLSPHIHAQTNHNKRNSRKGDSHRRDS